MIRQKAITHQFVRTVPRDLEAGVLYVSMEFATAVHSCCCGCGERIVTPFTPTDWKMVFDGETISLSPSVGNWQIPCRSHYVIRNGRVVDAGPWSQAQVEQGLKQEETVRKKYFEEHASKRPSAIASTAAPPAMVHVGEVQDPPKPNSVWEKIAARVRQLFF